MGATASMIVACSPQPKQNTTAQVISITSRVSRWKPNQFLVEFRSPDGSTAAKLIPAPLIQCQVGDIVVASVQGINLEVDEKACL